MKRKRERDREKEKEKEKDILASFVSGIENRRSDNPIAHECSGILSDD